MGAEAIYDLLVDLDLDSLACELRALADKDGSQQRKTEALKRLQVVESFRASNRDGKENRPEWMILQVIPVIPPELRPLVPPRRRTLRHIRPQRPLPSRNHT